MPGLAQWIKGSGIATAVTQIQSLARELPYARGAAIKKQPTNQPTEQEALLTIQEQYWF